jgi:N-methylhydantoinase A/oxoprolinase/acetone carboxylase beta subunit
MLSLAEFASGFSPGPRPRGGRLEIDCELRYRGQAHELTVPVRPLRTLARRFHERHRERYGFADSDAEIEVVSVRTSTVRPGPSVELRRAGRIPAVRGPASVALDGATLWVAPGWSARRRDDHAARRRPVT